MLGWGALTASGVVAAFALPSPGTVVVRLVRDLTGPVIWPYLGQTVIEALGGTAVGVAVALPLALLLHRFGIVEAAISPYLGATQAIPAVAIAPLLVFWVGYGVGGIVTLCALMVFFPIVVTTLVGLRHVDADVIDAARIDGASRARVLAHIELPMALPSLLAGLRNGVTLSVTGAVVGEMVMGGHGLGTLLTLQRDCVDTAGMFSTILLLCALAMVAYGAIRLWEKHSRTITSLQRRSGKDA